jgi:hypothetical protein
MSTARTLSTAEPVQTRSVPGPVANGTATGYATGDAVFKAAASVEPEAERLLDIGKARDELSRLSFADIERTTALAWGARALACYEDQPDATLPIQLQRFCDGEAYRQEAFEHATMADSDGKLLAAIRLEVDAARATALVGLQMAYSFPA